MGSGSAPDKDTAGSRRLLVGGLAIIGSLFLLVPGINQSSAMVYRHEDGDPDKADHEIDEPYLGEGRRVTAGRLESRLRRGARYRSW